MHNGLTTANTGFFGRLKAAFATGSQCMEISLQESYKLKSASISLPFDALPIELELGDNAPKFHLFPEQPIAADESPITPNCILFDPRNSFSEIRGFLRLSQGDHLILGLEDELQRQLFNYPDSLAKRQLSIVHTGDALQFKTLNPSSPIWLRPLGDERQKQRIYHQRMKNVRTLREIFGGPIRLLTPEEALADLHAINEILEKEPLRPRNSAGKPGGVVTLPKKMIPIIVGDLHAQLNNLLTILSHNEFLEMMGDGKAAMIFLGDAVHSEMDGELEEMESSLLIMDFIFRLKLWFPQQVFYVRGNHDSFSEEIGKGGVPQGLLWKHVLESARGEAYRKAMDHFYELLPYLALSDTYAACHAAPPKSKVSMDMLIDIHRYPSLIEELTRNRLYQPNRPAGYTRGDVKRFRDTLDLGPKANFFVGHTPLTRYDTLWHNVGGIKHHDVVFSGNQPWIGLFTRVDGNMIPLRYRSEPLLPFINELPNTIHSPTD